MGTGNNEEQKKIGYFPLSSRVRIHLLHDPMLVLPKALEEEIERIWKSLQQEMTLFNAPLFNLLSYDEEKILGRFVEYRHFIACQKSPELRKTLEITPLGISGLCIAQQRILVGTRDTRLSSYGGYIECVPSGTLEARAYSHGEVDFFRQLEWELEEEAYIGAQRIKEIHPLGLFYFHDTRVYDIGLLVFLDLQEHELDLRGTQLEGSPEYPLLEWLSFDEWERKLADPQAKVVPLSSFLWKHWRKMHSE